MTHLLDLLSYGPFWLCVFVVLGIFLAIRHDRHNEENLKSLSEPVHSSTLGFTRDEIRTRSHLYDKRRGRTAGTAGRTAARR